MARNPRRIDAQLDTLYEQVPDIPDCDGSCYDSCCFAEASIRERQRIEQASGRKFETIDRAKQYTPTVVSPTSFIAPIAHDGGLLPRFTCSMLDDSGRCTQYELRPMVCRLYGATEGLECSRGCKPILSTAEGFALMAESLKIGGSPKSINVDPDMVRAGLSDPDTAETFRGLVRRLDELGSPGTKGTP